MASCIFAFDVEKYGFCVKSSVVRWEELVNTTMKSLKFTESDIIYAISTANYKMKPVEKPVESVENFAKIVGKTRFLRKREMSKFREYGTFTPVNSCNLV